MYKNVNGKRVKMSAKQEAKIRAEWEANRKAQEKYERDYGYRDKRREKILREMPIGDQLDVIWKCIYQLHLSNIKLPQEAVKMLRSILATKKQYRKPEKELK